MNRETYRRRRGRSSTNWLQKSTRFAIYARDSYDCVYCHGMFPPAYDGSGLTLDHIIPRSQKGSNDPTNLVTSCLSCNSKRQSKPLPEKELKRLQEQASKPINRELGRCLAEVFYSVRERGLIHPLTLRIVPKPLSCHPKLQLNLGPQWLKYNYMEGD